jgi:acyl carrier protein
MSSTAERIIELTSSRLGIGKDKIIETARFIDDLGADSLAAVQLVMALEEEFQCKIPDDQAERLLTVGDAISFMEAHTVAGPVG